MRGKKGRWNEKDEADETEFTDMIIIDGKVYLENELPTEVVDDLSEVFDEDLLYEAYRDDQFDRKKRCK